MSKHNLPASAVCPRKETQTDLGCSSPSQPCPYGQEHAKTASHSPHDEIQTWPLNTNKHEFNKHIQMLILLHFLTPYEA